MNKISFAVQQTGYSGLGRRSASRLQRLWPQRKNKGNERKLCKINRGAKDIDDSLEDETFLAASALSLWAFVFT